jgi:hypothetical protein
MPSTIANSTTHHPLDPQSDPGNVVPASSYDHDFGINNNQLSFGHATHLLPQASLPPGFDASAFDATASQFPAHNQNGLLPISDYALPPQQTADPTSMAAPAYAGSSFSSVDNMPDRSNAH